MNRRQLLQWCGSLALPSPKPIPPRTIIMVTCSPLAPGAAEKIEKYLREARRSAIWHTLEIVDE